MHFFFAFQKTVGSHLKVPNNMDTTRALIGQICLESGNLYGNSRNSFMRN